MKLTNKLDELNISLPEIIRLVSALAILIEPKNKIIMINIFFIFF